MQYILIWLFIAPNGMGATGSEVFSDKDSCEYASKRVELMAGTVRTTCTPYYLRQILNGD